MSEMGQAIRKHILLADDQQEVRDTIKLLLRLDEHTVAEAKNGREALEMFTQDRFDLVITDYAMAPSQPILMLTGSAELLDGLSTPVDALLRKPFSLLDLRQAIAQLC
jgi:CheY-like chemotaxis protein